MIKYSSTHEYKMPLGKNKTLKLVRQESKSQGGIEPATRHLMEVHHEHGSFSRHQIEQHRFYALLDTQFKPVMIDGDHPTETEGFYTGIPEIERKPLGDNN